MNSEVTYLLVEPRCFILIVYNPGHSSERDLYRPVILRQKSKTITIYNYRRILKSESERLYA